MATRFERRSICLKLFVFPDQFANTALVSRRRHLAGLETEDFERTPNLPLKVIATVKQETPVVQENAPQLLAFVALDVEPACTSRYA